MRVFWTHGFEEASLARLTGEMGIRAPSLYAAFGDKQGLFDEAVERYRARMGAGIVAALSAPDPRVAVERLLRGAAAGHTDDATPAGCLVMSEPCLDAVRTEVRDALAERLHAAAAAGDLPAGVDPDGYAALVGAVLVGMSSRARDGATRAELDGVVDQLLAAWPLEGAAT